MTTESLVYFLLLALAAEILGTIGGFGSSMFFVPIASFFFDFQTVLGITALFHVSSNISKIALFKEGIDSILLLKMGIPAVVFVIIGAFLSKYIQSKTLEISLSIFIIIISIILLIFKNSQIYPSTQNAIGGGLISGFIAGIVGTGGAIRGIFLTAFNLKSTVFIATSASIDLGIDISRSIIYYANGFVHTELLYLIPLLMIVSFVGTYLGKVLLQKIPTTYFKKIVLILALFTGLVSLIKLIV
jgi:uncharacterized membrane protein YfcA